MFQVAIVKRVVAASFELISDSIANAPGIRMQKRPIRKVHELGIEVFLDFSQEAISNDIARSSPNE
jgi:hypothetical protein